MKYIRVYSNMAEEYFSGNVKNRKHKKKEFNFLGSTLNINDSSISYRQ